MAQRRGRINTASSFYLAILPLHPNRSNRSSRSSRVKQNSDVNRSHRRCGNHGMCLLSLQLTRSSWLIDPTGSESTLWLMTRFGSNRGWCIGIGYSILLNIPIIQLITIQWTSCRRLLHPISLIPLPSLSPLLLIIDTSLLLVTSPLILCLRPILRLQSLRLQLSPLLQLSADTNCYFRFGSTTTPSDSGPILCGYRSLFPYCSYCFGLLFVGLSSSMRIDSDSSSCFGRLQYQGRFNGYFNSSWSVYFDHRGGYYYFWSLVSGSLWFGFRFGWYFRVCLCLWSTWSSRVRNCYFGLHFVSSFGTEAHNPTGTDLWSLWLAWLDPSSTVDHIRVILPYLWTWLPPSLYSVPLDSNLDCSGLCSAPIRVVTQLFGLLWIQVWNTLDPEIDLLLYLNSKVDALDLHIHTVDPSRCRSSISICLTVDPYSLPRSIQARDTSASMLAIHSSIHIRSQSWVSSAIYLSIQLTTSNARVLPVYKTTSCSKTTSLHHVC